MSVLGNLLWLVLGGFIAALGWAIAGVILCITIVGAPFGVQCLKIANLTLMPFGREVTVGHFGASGLIGNVLWLLFLGWELCLAHLAIAIVLGITIIGLPFAKQHIKLAQLALVPFGAKIS